MITDVIEGLAAYRRAEAGYIDGAWAEDRDGILLVSLGLPPPWANIAQVLRPLAEPAVALRQAWSRFADAGRPMSVLVAHGEWPEVEAELPSIALKPQQTLNAMVRRPAIRPYDLPPGLSIQPVTTTDQLEAMLDVQADAFETDRAMMGRLHPPAALREPRLRFYAGLVDGAPVASAECFASGGLAGISGVSTLASHRRRGIATAMTNHAIAQSGADVAWLLADDEDMLLYQTMGFVRVGAMETYSPL